jgi:hypothetical protein
MIDNFKKTVQSNHNTNIILITAQTSINPLSREDASHQQEASALPP